MKDAGFDNWVSEHAGKAFELEPAINQDLHGLRFFPLEPKFQHERQYRERVKAIRDEALQMVFGVHV